VARLHSNRSFQTTPLLETPSPGRAVSPQQAAQGRAALSLAASQMLQFAQARMAKRRMQLALTLRQEVA
jgi:hypothetical protein